MARDERTIAELQARLRRYGRDRYPVQHATAQFHLGVALAAAGDLEPAEEALATAAELFSPGALPAEHAKALNALGSVLRMAGRPAQAAPVLARAAATFAAAGLAAEQGAATFNLGLVSREAGDPDAAAQAFAAARRTLEGAGAPAQAAAAARELGTLRLEAGELGAAREELRWSLAAAARAGDRPGAGAAANVLGLVELADDRPAAAVERFASAVAAHPRRVRPQDHAMAKANLALAHERAGDAVRARVAARQALGVAQAPPPVRRQATEILARLPAAPDDAVVLVERETPERRVALAGEELARWVDLGDAERRTEASAWIDAQLARPAAAVALAEALVGALLELPPDELQAVLRAVVQALRDRPPAAQEEFRAQIAMAAARFHVPQLVRLRDELNRAAVALGEEPAWR